MVAIRDVHADKLFEASWEVCNKVGGIYTVVKSKTPMSLEAYGGRYVLIGPYFPHKVHGEFEEKVPPDDFKHVFETLKKEGIHCHYGTWLISGNPNVVLVDFAGYTYRKDELKTSLWDHYRIDSLGTQYYDFDEPVIWCGAVSRLLEEMSKKLSSKKLVAHFHEWMAGVTLLFLKIRKAKISTVFTTHATMLGRTLAGNDVRLYAELHNIDPDKAAYDYGIAAKHQTEKQCAHNADVFTTVSEITGIEAESFFGRKPDVLVHNGLDISTFPTFEEITIRHKLFKNRVKEFLLYYFFPYYSFDLSQTLLFFSCARYEVHAKGLDVLIKALGKLNRKLKDSSHRKTVVFFFWIPAGVRGIKPSVLESKTFYTDVKDSVDESMEDIKNNLLQAVVADSSISRTTLFDRSIIDDIHKKLLRLKRDGEPPMCTHDLTDEGNDPIMNMLRQEELFNSPDDRVKVVFYPIYLTGADGLLDTAYYESMQGCHLGVFPSYYEPWGYTPLECGALGVPSITTDLAGFGRFIGTKLDKKQDGIFVLPRYGHEDEEEIQMLADTMFSYAELRKEERVQTKIQAKKLASYADWKVFIDFYIKAHNLAVERKK